jgi:branched-subunit amino acid ABC-type transport system permease component
MSLLIGSITIGLILAMLALGIFISFRIFNFPDITAEGSFTFGASIGASLIVGGVNPLLSLALAFAGGFAAGVTTGLIHTRFNINPLLAGIFVMTALYSVNLHVMGRSIFGKRIGSRKRHQSVGMEGCHKRPVGFGQLFCRGGFCLFLALLVLSDEFGYSHACYRRQ